MAISSLKFLRNSLWVSGRAIFTRSIHGHACCEQTFHGILYHCQLTAFPKQWMYIQQPYRQFFSALRLQSKDHAKGSLQQRATVTRKPVEIQVIGTHGEPLSPMTRRKAEQLAQEKNLKLVVIDANSQPLPTWQLMTMQQYLSERQTLRQNKQAMKQPSTKIVKISASIAQHDLDTKVSHTVEWLKKGHPVKFVISNSKDEKGAESVFNSVVAATKDVSTVQQAKQTTTDMTFHMTPKCAASSGDCPPPSNMPPPSDPSRVDKVQKPFKLDELRKLQASTQAAEAENKKDAS